MASKILYNVTIKIESELNSEWLSWMKQVHIPAVLATGCFDSYRITKIMGDDDEHGVGFAIQYVCPSIQLFETYRDQFAPALQQHHSDRYKNQYVAFRTLMEIVDEG
jgi:Domain of unknown function (DUF4286)